jgi:hypothetical protein
MNSNRPRHRCAISGLGAAAAGLHATKGYRNCRIAPFPK